MSGSDPASNPARVSLAWAFLLFSSEPLTATSTLASLPEASQKHNTAVRQPQKVPTFQQTTARISSSAGAYVTVTTILSFFFAPPSIALRTKSSARPPGRASLGAPNVNTETTRTYRLSLPKSLPFSRSLHGRERQEVVQTRGGEMML